MKKLLAVSLADAMEKIKSEAERKTVEKSARIFHRRKFSLAVSKGLAKWSRDREDIADNVINETWTILSVVSMQSS